MFTKIVSTEPPNVAFVDSKTTVPSIDLDYECVAGDVYLFKYRLILPIANSQQLIKIKHGYDVTIPDNSIFKKPVENLSDLFSQLMITSLGHSSKIANMEIRFEELWLLNTIKAALSAHRN